MSQVQYVCTPPYSQIVDHLSTTPLVALPAGSIVLATRATTSLISNIARSSPSAIILVGLQAGEVVTSASLESLRRAGASAVLVLDAGTPMVVDILRTARITTDSVRGELGIRLGLLGHTISPSFEAALEALVSCEEASSTRHWALAMGESVRSLERRCAKDWLAPAPRCWVALVRAIRAVQRLQCSAEGSVEYVLTQGGFPDAPAVRKLLSRICDVSPARVRSLIGWYFVVDRWCARSWQCTIP